MPQPWGQINQSTGSNSPTRPIIRIGALRNSHDCKDSMRLGDAPPAGMIFAQLAIYPQF
jgi:hypothetical protein